MAINKKSCFLLLSIKLLLINDKYFFKLFLPKHVSMFILYSYKCYKIKYYMELSSGGKVDPKHDDIYGERQINTLCLKADENEWYMYARKIVFGNM